MCSRPTRSDTEHFWTTRAGHCSWVSSARKTTNSYKILIDHLMYDRIKLRSHTCTQVVVGVVVVVTSIENCPLLGHDSRYRRSLPSLPLSLSLSLFRIFFVSLFSLSLTLSLSLSLSRSFILQRIFWAWRVSSLPICFYRRRRCCCCCRLEQSILSYRIFFCFEYISIGFSLCEIEKEWTSTGKKGKEKKKRE